MGTLINDSTAAENNYASSDHPRDRVRSALMIAGKRGRIGLKYHDEKELAWLMPEIARLPIADQKRVYVLQVPKQLAKPRA